MLESWRTTCWAAAFTLIGGTAGAVSVTFDALPVAGPIGGQVYVENGVTVTGNLDLGYFTTPGALHLDDSGTSISTTAIFTMENPFVPVGFDVLGLGTAFCGEDDECLASQGVPYDNVLVSASVGGSTAFEDSFFAGETGSVLRYLFPTGVGLVDALRISAVVPEGSCFNAPCGHFDIDNVTLAPVPAPAPLLLLLGAMAGIGLVARRRDGRTVFGGAQAA